MARQCQQFTYISHNIVIFSDCYSLGKWVSNGSSLDQVNNYENTHDNTSVAATTITTTRHLTWLIKMKQNWIELKLKIYLWIK